MKILKPNWPKLKNIVAFTSLKNCDLKDLQLPKNICWLEQEHGKNILNIDQKDKKINFPIADGSYTQQKNLACVIKTADCLPILITDLESTFVAALHAGWRGLAKGIIDQFFIEIKKLNLNLNKLCFWLGPAIGPKAFEVGEDVIDQFKLEVYRSTFKKIKINPNKYLGDLYKLATINLNFYGIDNHQIFSQYYCTFSNPDLFYSYRSEPKTTQRMCSFIWVEGN